VCGIIGYVGSREAKPLLLEGLRRLEYRGYDSAGIALREDDSLEYVRAVGTLGNLVEAAGPNGSHSHHGLGHTRWATHGGVTEQNAHPLTGCEPDRLAIVLNGIIENYVELRRDLAARGHTLTSETDAEVVVHLLEEQYEGDLRRRSRGSIRSSRATSRSSRSTTTSPTCSSASDTRRRSSSGSGTERTSSPRRSPPSSARPAP
jgi:Glucosamine 6-phosphate synthetase, contains amidotransferase and phosphosugar isomerase domains